jgi:hypothetical protein
VYVGFLSRLKESTLARICSLWRQRPIAYGEDIVMDREYYADLMILQTLFCVIKSDIYPTECTFKLLFKNVKTYVKIYSAPTCFGLTIVIRELTVCTSLKL